MADVRGVPISDLTDPVAWGVHRPIAVQTPGPQPVQPRYLRRAHDESLARMVARAAEGRSGIAVLVGGSSTGRTRACWEALHGLPSGWRLWQPSDRDGLAAVPTDLFRTEPRTVVWLDDLHQHLDQPGDTGERVATALRALLADHHRSPVLVLGTLWPTHWARLTRGGSRYVQARALLSGADVPVPAAFTGPARVDLLRVAGTDARLRMAAQEARDGQVTQYLAGVPALLDRYRHAPPAARALIHAAMDARRLGHRPALPLAFLVAAAPAYLTDADRDALREDWLEQALAHVAEPCRGVPGPLHRIRPPYPGRPGPGDGLRYRLAGCLDQHGHDTRRGIFPPAGFWAAAADHVDPADQAALGDAAQARGLYRHAGRLHRSAARGNRRGVAYLLNAPDPLRTDDRPLRWAAAHATLEDPAAVAQLLDRLRRANANEQVATLLRRDPAAHVSLDDPAAVAGLLVRLSVVGAPAPVTALARRAAAHTGLTDPAAVAGLLDGLRGVGARDQVAVLARRAAAEVGLTDPAGIVPLLVGLRGVGAHDQVAVLARRAAAQADLSDPAAVAGLLDGLREVGADEQVAALARRAAAHVALDDAFAVAQLLDWFGTSGAHDQLTVLGGRVATDADHQDPALAAGLLDGLRGAGADDQVTVLANRAAAHADLTDPAGVAQLLDRLTDLGAHQQISTLLARDPAAHAGLDRPTAVAALLDQLSEAGADQQVAALADRAAAHADLTDPAGVAQLLDRLTDLGAHQQISTLLARDPAAHAGLDRPAAVAWLLHELGEAGADGQVDALAERAAAHLGLDHPILVAGLLDRLHEMGARDQARTLAGRAAAHISLDSAAAVAQLLGRLHGMGAHDQVATLLERDPAAQVSLSDSAAVAGLLDRLRELGADDQVGTLVDRLPAEGEFDLFLRLTGATYRYGREPDGRPADPWDWSEVDAHGPAPSA
ncbi:hypothetical protein [Micromonospora sp. RP3T]|uniref:hypothetical protein n=1 Tax=Micromonospora sp. RP3T TaxID=2135446 RepID=UPI000D17464F|nr:hypothetical protein [Micromonospora sp. RP3T]PTA45209.1 hypothetical protein C8054_16520 [Micromonospora sp. RP3T]